MVPVPPNSQAPARRARRPRRPTAPPQNGAPIASLSTSAPLANSTTDATDKSAYLSTVKFRDFQERGLLSPSVLQRIPFEQCTEVQAKTLEPIVQGSDVFGQAKTGTGKTIAFLVPSIERLSRQPMPRADIISILVIAPTRELAMQIKVEADMLLQGTPYTAQAAIGGVNIKPQRAKMLTERTDILIGTPGRLVDHIETSNFAPRLKNVKTLILDEADRLLDSGFRTHLLQITNEVPPKEKRQTLLFSATVDKTIQEIASVVLRPNHQFITTIGANEGTTHEHVKQEYIVTSLGKIDPVVLSLIRRSLKDSSAPNPKIIIFYPTARAAGTSYDTFRAMPELKALPMFELHSRLNQTARTRQTEEFRKAPRGVLFSSDVSARGLDIPGITAVFQVGLPSSTDQYIHRLGRTARAGAGGHGILILADFEQFFVKKLHAVPLEPHAEGDQLQDATNPEFASAQAAVIEALTKVEPQAKEQAYGAFLGYYNGALRNLGWSKTDLVRWGNEYAKNVLRYENPDGSGKPPPLQSKTVGKMGMKGVPGLNVAKYVPPDQGAERQMNGAAGRAPAPAPRQRFARGQAY